jgi:hypothetical protein
MKIFEFFLKYLEKMVEARAEMFDKLEPELEPETLKNGPAPQHCLKQSYNNRIEQRI